MKKMLAILCALCMLMVTPAMAMYEFDGVVDSEQIQPFDYSGTKDSAHKTVQAGNYSYDCYATLYYGSTSKACLWLVENGRRDAPASLRSYLYENGDMIGDSGWSNSNSYIHFLNTGNYSVSGHLAADGEYKAYHDQSRNDYTAGHSYTAEYNYSGRSIAKEAVTSYPVNENGETYGSYLDRHTVGYAPDLIRVRGDEGKSGYVHLSEFRAAEAGDSLTVYDLEGNAVDTFSMRPGEVSEDQVAQVAQMEQVAFK